MCTRRVGARVPQAHAVSGHKSQGQTLARIVLSHLYAMGVTGEEYCLLRSWGWFYTAVSRTKMGTGLKLAMRQLPLAHMQKRRHDVLAEMARVQVIHEETFVRVHGTPATREADRHRVAAARAALMVAKRAFR